MPFRCPAKALDTRDVCGFPGLLRHIHYTLQVWKKPGWPLGSEPQGIFVQLETGSSKKVLFLPEGALKDGKVEAHVLDDDFKVLERLLR